MGHQVNYYATPVDIAELDRRIRDRLGRCIIPDRSPSNEPMVIDGPEYQVGGRPWLFYYLVRPDQLDKVIMRNVPTQGYWTVDDFISPVIQFNTGIVDEEKNEIRPGRLYYVDGYYGADETWVDYSDAFLKWAQSILRIAKKTFVKRKESFYYIGHDALRWLESGNGKLG